MGRLMLNVHLSFAQFERELIAERTRDKIQAARRHGKWTGGRFVLGYGLDSAKHKLRVIEEEARLVRVIFDLYPRGRSAAGAPNGLRAPPAKHKQHRAPQ